MYAQHSSVQVNRFKKDFYPSSLSLSQHRFQSTATVVNPRKRRAILGIGTNMGKRVENLANALKELERDGTGTTVKDTSSLYESDAMYVTDQDKFLNAAVEVSSPFSSLGKLPEPCLIFPHTD